MGDVNTQTERGVLAAIIRNAESAPIIVNEFRVSDFSDPRVRHAVEAARRLDERNDAIDALAIWDEMQRRPAETMFSTYQEMLSATNGMPAMDAAGIQRARRTLRDSNIRRRLKRVCADAAERAEAGTQSAFEIMSFIDESLDQFREFDISKGFRSFEQIANDMERIYRDYLAGKTDALPTGYQSLDDILSPRGLLPGEMMVVAAATSGGKSAFAMGCARYVARHRGPVAIISREMADESLFKRAHAAESGVPLWKIRAGIHSGEFDKLMGTMKEMRKLPVYIDDATSSINDICARIRNLVRTKGVKLVIVDYIQLIEGPDDLKKSRVQEVSYVSRKLKNLALDLKVPIISLSQLNRAYIATGRAELHHLKEAGQLEQDADVVVFIDTTPPEKGRTLRPATLRVAKQRNGPADEADYIYNGDYLTFHEAEGAMLAAVSMEKREAEESEAAFEEHKAEEKERTKERDRRSEEPPSEKVERDLTEDEIDELIPFG
jgi:replicative DNA helicase